MTDLKKLFAEFPRDQITWRAQSVTKDGSKAMALAYIDARDVMNRLDDVCGIDGWQCKYSHANGKTICDIGIRCGNEWIWKADGAGDTDIEAEKGAISDAFKRAAVKWGIGRYLYDLPCPWVPCKSYESGGKWKWSEFTESPWNYVKTAQKPVRQTETASDANERTTIVWEALDASDTFDDFWQVMVLHRPWIDTLKSKGDEVGEEMNKRITNAARRSTADLIHQITKLKTSEEVTAWARANSGRLTKLKTIDEKLHSDVIAAGAKQKEAVKQPTSED